MEIVDVNGLNGTLTIMDKGIKYKVPYNENMYDGGDYKKFVCDFYFDEERYIAVSINGVSYLMKYELYEMNPDCLSNFRCIDTDNGFIVTAYSPARQVTEPVYHSHNYIDCVKFINDRIEEPHLQICARLIDGSSILIDNIDKLYAYSDDFVSEINVDMDLQNRVDINIKLIMNVNGEFVINGDIANLKVIIENYDIVQFLNAFVREYEVKKVLISDSKKQKSFLIDLSNWYISKKLFNE